MTTTADSFYVTGGTLRQDAPSYVERQADKDLYAGLLRGEFCYVLTSRQMGKSSLMVHTAARLRAAGIAVAVLDLTAFGQNLSVEQWYGGLLRRVGLQLDPSGAMEEALDDLWFDQEERTGPLERWMKALQQIVLPRISERVVLFIDEIDAVRSLPFSTDEFFAAIRECYNRRAQDPEFERLSFCLLGVASPSDLIQDVRMTPFNIGRRIELTDFTEAEAAPLAAGLFDRRDAEDTENSQRVSSGASSALPPRSLRLCGAEGARLLQRVLYWTGGHPYLTQQVCQALATERTGETSTDPLAPSPCSPVAPSLADVDRLCEMLLLTRQARETDDNLTFVRSRLLNSEADLAALLELYRRVWNGKPVADDEANPLVSLLKLSGVVRAAAGVLRVRNRVYARVFDGAWIREQMPGAELRRQRRAFWRGVARTVTISAVIIAVIGTLALIAAREARRANGSERVAKRQAAAAEEGRETLRRTLYAAQTSLAQQAWEAGDCGRAIQLLDMQRPRPGQADLRGFEWRYLWRLCQGDSIRTFRGHTDRVGTVAFSPDGKTLATASEDKTLRLWDVAGRKPPVVLRGHTQKVKAVAFSPDGRLLASGSGVWSRRSVPGEVMLWDVASGRVIASLKGHTRVVNSVAFSPDGKLLATASEDNTVRLWDVAARRQVARLPAASSGANDVAFSPDGRLVATISGEGPVQIWEVRTHEEVARLGPPEGGGCLAFSPDGRLLAFGDDQSQVQLWELKTSHGRPRGRRIAVLRGHRNLVSSLAFSPDGRMLASGGWDSTVRLWDVARARKDPATAVRAVLRGHTDAVWSVAFSPDGKLLASGSDDGTAKLWRPFPPPSPSLLTGRKARLTTQQLSPTGRILALGYADGAVDVWDTASRTRQATLAAGPNTIFTLTFSPDDQWLGVVAGLPDRPAGQQNVKLWNFAAKRVITLPKLPTTMIRMAFSPDGTTLALGGDDHAAHLWELGGGGRPREVALLKGHTGAVGLLAFSPNGRLLATGSADETVRVWSLGPAGKGRAPRAARLTATLRGRAGFLDNVVFSPDGRTLATMYSDRSIRLWDAATAREIATLQGYELPTGVAFSPDGKTLASGSFDGAVELWNLATRQEVVTLRGHETYAHLAFSPDGNLLTTSSRDVPLRQWRAAPLAETAKGTGEAR